MKVRRKRKTGRKILAVVLSVCMLFAGSPNLWGAVMVQAAEPIQNGTDAIMQTLLDRIAALPDAEEYLALEPDMEENEDTYAEWEERLYEYAEEALAIWGGYGALTEEQQVQISEEELAKLTAWMEIAETLKESSQVMAADNGSHKHCVCGGNINIGDHTSHTEDIVYDNILTSDNGQLLVNGAVQSDYTLTSGSYYLADDVALNSELVIVENSTVYICLNNHTLSYDRSNGKHRVMTVGEKATLNLCTCGNSGVITGGDADSSSYGGGLYLSGNSIFNMYGGSIEGNVTSGSGGGIFSGQYAACNLYEVNICRNTGLNGAGILLSHILNIYGGEIKNNDATGYGGGIAGTAESCILQDVKICNNTAAYAAGLYWANGNLIMSDVEISNNIVSDSTARYPAGGVALMQGTIGISGTIIITGNQYNGKQNNFWNYCNPSTTRPSKLVIVDDLDEQSVIGLTNRTTPTEDAPDPVEVASGSNHTITDADWSRFFSDSDTYEILLDKTNNLLLLSYPGSCDLFNLSASGATLSPEFKASDTEYTSTVANSVDQVGITATLASTASGADITIKINGAVADMENGVPKPVDLIEGKNTIAITVTSGGMSKTYTIEITREAPEVPAHYNVKLNGNGGAGIDLKSYTYGTGAKLPTGWTKTGHDFAGWYEDESCEGTAVTEISATTTGDKEYWAKWTPKSYTVTLNGNEGSGGTDLTSYTYGTGATMPLDWTRAGYDFAGWYDNESCTGTAVTNILGTDTGNKEYWAKWTDNIAPVIGTLTYNYQPKNLWQWLIGKDSLVITVPVTEEGSGADKITYTVTPDGGTASTKTANIMDGKAEITVSADFKGTISIACTDKANNTSASVTVGAGVAPNGVIIEDNAPEIAFTAENAELLQTTGEYRIAPDITVTVADNKDNAVSGGIASVSYKIGNGSNKTVAHDYTAGMVASDSFTIPASEISVGETVISVTATDHAGNSITTTYTVKVHTHSGTLVPAVEPTCTAAGNKEHYKCSCGKWFSDSGCKNEITDKSSVVVDALEHDFSGEYLFDKNNHWKKCSRCPETDLEEAHIFETDGIHCTVCDYEKAGEGHIHSGELHGAIEPNCTTAGNIAYYTCHCGGWFLDSDCTAEITDKSVIEIEKLGHDFIMKQDLYEHWQQCSRCHLEQSGEPHEYDNDMDTECNVCGYVRTIQHTHSGTLVPAKTETCTEDGNQAYYICSCGKWFSDSECTAEVTEQGVVIAAKGHDFTGGYQYDEKDHWKKCTRCEETQSKAEHKFDNDMDRDCNVCGYGRTIENPPGGAVSKDVEKDEKAPDTVLSNSAEELADIILTEEEKVQVENGTDIKFILEVKDAGDTVNSSDKTAVQQALSGDTEVKGFSIGQYLDISLFKVIGDTRSAVSQTARKLTIVINVPDSLKSKDSAKPRTYAIIRVHDGVAETLADLDDDADTITIATNRFSAYALVYKEAGSGTDVTPTPAPGGSEKPSPTPDGGDKPSPTPDGSIKPSLTPGGKDPVSPTPSPTGKPQKASDKEKRQIEIHSGLKAIQTGKKLQILWGRVSGADGYSVYVQYCGKDFSAKSLNQVKSGRKTKIIVKKVNGKKLDTTKNFKLYVVAWQWKNGKKSTLTKTLTIHIAGKDSVKYINVKSIQAGKSSYTLIKGGTVTLHPKAVLYDKRKKQLSLAHCKEFRYLSSNKKVATVTAGGKVKAKGTGECTIYVFAKNGCRRKIKIKVKVKG